MGVPIWRKFAYTAGKMKKNRIKTLAGDRVTIEMSPYDLEKGRLIFRHKDERRTPAPRGAGRRAAASFADGKQTFNVTEDALGRPLPCAVRGRLAGRIKKSCTSGLF